MLFKPEAIWTDMLPICMWGGWGCVIGWVSKYDHPPEGIWLTFSSLQTLVWDCCGVAAGLTKNPAVVPTSVEVLAIPCRAGLTPTSASVFVRILDQVESNLLMLNTEMC